jgi:phage terminase large subunit
MREIAGDIRGSLWKDLTDRIEEKELPSELFAINETAMSIKCLLTGNEIISKGFKKSSGKSTAKLKSIAGATDVLIEEAEEVTREDLQKLDDSLRTIKGDGVRIYMLFNMQNKDHSIHEDWHDLTPANYEDYSDVVPLEFKDILEEFFFATPKKREDFLAIFSDYKDNIKNLDKSTIKNFLEYAKDEKTIEHFLSDILGLVSPGKKGRIYRLWELFDILPQDREYYKMYGMDFGYDPDPTVLIELNIDKKRRRVYERELFREKELSTYDIYKLCKAHGVKKDIIVCDSAEKREQNELQNYGLNFIKSQKFPGSVGAGIKIVKAWDLFIHKDSKEYIKEKENFAWEVNADGKPTGKPVDAWKHGNDAERYGLEWYNKNYGYRYKDKTK